MVDKINELEKGKLYWITIKNATPEILDHTAELGDKAGLQLIVSDERIEFKKIPKGMTLKKVGNSFVVE